MEKLQAKDFRLIGICLLIVVASLAFLDKYFYQAFPEASIQFKVGRKDSMPVAQKFLNDLAIGAATEGYRHSVIFDHDEQAKVFLERELGLSEASKFMGSRVKLWRWSHRWFKPLQKEELRVFVSPEGSVNGFSHLLPEEAPGATLRADSARALAEAFLRQRLGLDLAQLELVDKDSKLRPHRTDHTFTYKVSGLNIHEADYRYSVGIWGAAIGSFSEFLHVPEAWERDYQKLRARNESTGLVAGMFLVITILGTLWFCIDRARRRDVRWKVAVWFAVIGAVLTFLAQLNVFNLREFGYDTTESYTSFLVRSILSALIAGAAGGALIFVLTAGGEPLYRERYGDKISLTNHFRWRGLRTKNFVTGVILGVTLAFFFATYQTGFYVVAQRLGAWSPAEIPYSDLLNTTFPWIFVLLAGFFPAVSEEFMSRLFSIPFLERILKRRWLAVVIPALIWGFGHANYPQQPFYIRGLEVGVAGVIIGYLMLRYNILVTLIWHYTVDALYTGLLMFRSGNAYLVISAAIAAGIMLVPLAAALWMYWRRGGFEPETGLLNKEEGSALELPAPAPAPAVAVHAVTPLQPKVRNYGLLLAVILAAAFFLPGDRFGDFADVEYKPERAVELARAFLRDQGYTLEGYDEVRVFHNSVKEAAVKYALLNGGVARANQLYDAEVPAMRWAVRFYKSLTKEEYRVHLDARTRQVVEFSRDLDEAAPGDSLDEAAALQTARAFLAAQAADIAGFALKESSSEKRKARSDHHFVWEAPAGDARHIAEAKYRVSVDLQGDRIGRFSRFLKLPENYERDRGKRGVWYAIHIGLIVIGFGLVIGLTIAQFVRFARSGTVPWRRALLLAIPLALLGTLGSINRYDTLRWAYTTSYEYQLFLTTTIVGLAIQLVVQYALVALLIGLAIAAYAQASAGWQFPQWRGQARVAFWATIILVASRLGLRQLIAFVEAQLPAAAVMGDLPELSMVDATSPIFGYALDAISDGILMPAIAAIGVLLFAQLIKKNVWRILLAIVLVFAATPMAAQSAAEVGLHVSQGILAAVWLVLAIRFIARDTALVYVSASVCLALVNGGLALSALSEGAFFNQGIALFVLAASWLMMLLWLGRGTQPQPAA